MNRFALSSYSLKRDFFDRPVGAALCGCPRSHGLHSGAPTEGRPYTFTNFAVTELSSDLSLLLS